MRIEIWSDIACPWCFVGKRRLEAAIESHPDVVSPEIVWRSFELDPSAPADRGTDQTTAERLAKKYGMPASRAERMVAEMSARGQREGAPMDFDKLRAGSSFDAHRLLHWARECGRQGELKERLFLAYFSEGVLLSDVASLVRLAEEAGLDEEEARAVLSSDRYADAVRQDESRAAQLGVRGVPFYVFADKYAVSGAQPTELLCRVFDEVLADRVQDPTGNEAAVCGPEGCA